MHALIITLLFAVQPAKLEASTTYQEAKRLVDAFEYQRAAALLERLSVDGSLSPADRARVNVELGVARAIVNDDAGAERAFAAALRELPAIELPADASPGIRAQFAAVKARVLSEAKAAPKPLPKPASPPSRSAPPLAPATPPAEDGEDGGMFYGGAAVMGAGVLVAAGGGGAWMYGLSVLEEARDTRFQSDARALSERSALLQGIGQGALVVGGAALIGGGVVLGLSFAGGEGE